MSDDGCTGSKLLPELKNQAPKYVIDNHGEGVRKGMLIWQALYNDKSKSINKEIRRYWKGSG